MRSKLCILLIGTPVLLSCTTGTADSPYESDETITVSESDASQDGCFDVDPQGIVSQHPYGKMREPDTNTGPDRYCTVDNGVQLEACIHPKSKRPYSNYATGIEIEGVPWDCIHEDKSAHPVWVRAGVPSSELHFECPLTSEVYFQIFLGDNDHNIAKLFKRAQKTEERVIMEAEEPTSTQHIFHEDLRGDDNELYRRTYQFSASSTPQLKILDPHSAPKTIACHEID